MRILLALVILVSPTLLTGCGSGDSFPVAKTTGRVVCEGQPVPHALVFFEPLTSESGSSSLVGKQGFAVAEADGTFAISTYGTRDGAVIGTHRVRVDRPLSKDHPDFNCPCVLNSEIDVMEVEIKKGETNDFELKLAKKTGKERPPIGADDE